MSCLEKQAEATERAERDDVETRRGGDETRWRRDDVDRCMENLQCKKNVDQITRIPPIP